jgi:RNA polymerase sigma factor (sigma-70 family)
MFDSETVSESFDSLSREQPAPESARVPTTRLVDASDEELARALLVGDPRAQHVTWQRFSPLVVRMARRAFGRHEDAEEVVQEVFLCLFRRVHTLRAPAAFRGFVIAIAKRTMSHERRRRRLRFYQASEDEQRNASELSVIADPAAKHALLGLEQLLARLRYRERNAFMLRFVEGMDAAEVGEKLGVSAPTARRSLARAWSRINVWASRDPFLADYLRSELIANC